MNEKFDFYEVLKNEEADNKEFDYIRFTISDINGVGKSIAVPRKHAEASFKNGVFFFQGKSNKYQSNNKMQKSALFYSITIQT